MKNKNQCIDHGVKQIYFYFNSTIMRIQIKEILPGVVIFVSVVMQGSYEVWNQHCQVLFDRF